MILSSRPRLGQLTSLRLGGRAQGLLVPESDGDYEDIPRLSEKYAGRPYVMGRGTNILAEDGDHDLTLVKRPCLNGPEVLREVGNNAVISVDGGMTLAGFMSWCIKHGYSGLESLSGIPGSFGGCVAMNAGSHGRECFELLQAVRVWTPGKGCFWAERSECTAGYRHFSLTDQDGLFAVLGVLVVLEKKSSEEVRQGVRSWFLRKKSVQPLTAATAGCVFKNPLNGSAGRFLDAAGLRGYALGGMRFSPVHANFLENTGKGTADQALELISLGRKEVSERSGVHLELEVEVLECR
ncbi:UDP-N-acetylmuramate dehydrogenase [Desulfoplanes sp.]